MNFNAWIVVFFLLLLMITEVISYNILFAVLFGSSSHKFALKPIAEELARRGHKVTMMTIIDSGSNIKTSSGVNEVFLRDAERKMKNKSYDFFMGTMENGDFMGKVYDTLCSVTNATYGDPFVQELIKNPGSQNFDVMVVDAVFNDFCLPLAHHLKIPTVYVSPASILPHVSWLLNVPTFYSYIPSNVIFLPGEMSLMQKIRSVYASLGFIYDVLFKWYPMEDRIIKQYLPDSPTLMELGRKVSFLLSNEHFSIGPKAPSMPYTMEVGGLHLRPTAKLPRDLEEFMNSSGNAGVIFFSLGSITKGQTMPSVLRDKLIKAFSQLEQKVLWKYETSLIGISRNVKIVDWAPQQDLLAHPKLKLFITHGGGLSIQESGYNGCPVLGLPLSADQQSNIANVMNAGFGEYINWKDFTVEEFVYKTKKLIEDRRYKENAMKIAALLKDRPEHPVRTASYWIEYVVRHNGAPHLRSGADKLNFFQYFLLDVICVALVSVVTILGLILFVIKKIIILLTTTGCNDVRKSKIH